MKMSSLMEALIHERARTRALKKAIVELNRKWAALLNAERATQRREKLELITEFITSLEGIDKGKEDVPF